MMSLEANELKHMPAQRQLLHDKKCENNFNIPWYHGNNDSAEISDISGRYHGFEHYCSFYFYHGIK